jgi:hypothetical protein
MIDSMRARRDLRGRRAAELGAKYAIWRWLREGATRLLALVGLACRFA